MPKYKLSVDEIVNTMKSIEMETNLSETELYALLSKIQQVEITSAETLSKMLEAHNVKVTNITTSGQP